MRVLLVVHDLSRAGAPRVALNIFKELKGQVELQIIALDGGPLQEEFEKIGKVTIATKATYRYHPLRFAAKLRQATFVNMINQSVKSFAPEVVYLNSVASIRVLESVNIPQTPILLHVHEMGVGLNGFWKRDGRLLKGRNVHPILVSEAAKRSFIEETGFSEDVKVIYPCVPFPQQSTRKGPLRTPPPLSPIIIGGSGTIEWRKGLQAWLLMAAAIIRLVGPEKVKFMWVGAKQDMETDIVVEQARILGIQNHVEFIQSTPDPFSYYAQMDIFAMTSWEDPCPLVVMENMLMGTPVAAFRNSGGAAEEIGATGIVVDDFSPESMADQIATLVLNNDLRVNLGEKARARATEMFSCAIQAQKILEELAKFSQR